eukprot:2317422-Pyramimonas_sp.AAC.1
MLAKLSYPHALTDGSRFLTPAAVAQVVRGLPDGARKLYPLDSHALLSLAQEALGRLQISLSTLAVQKSGSGPVPSHPLIWPHVVEMLWLPIAKLMDECCCREGWGPERKKRRQHRGTGVVSAFDELAAVWPCLLYTSPSPRDRSLS